MCYSVFFCVGFNLWGKVGNLIVLVLICNDVLMIMFIRDEDKFICIYVRVRFDSYWVLLCFCFVLSGIFCCGEFVIDGLGLGFVFLFFICVWSCVKWFCFFFWEIGFVFIGFIGLVLKVVFVVFFLLVVDLFK